MNSHIIAVESSCNPFTHLQTQHSSNRGAHFHSIPVGRWFYHWIWYKTALSILHVLTEVPKKVYSANWVNTPGHTLNRRPSVKGNSEHRSCSSASASLLLLCQTQAVSLICGQPVVKAAILAHFPRAPASFLRTIWSRAPQRTVPVPGNCASACTTRLSYHSPAALLCGDALHGWLTADTVLPG